MARVTAGGQSSEPFAVNAGVRQGCILAPTLFNIYLLYVTTLLYRTIANRSRINIDYGLDGNLFNIRRFQARTKVYVDDILELQYADDLLL